MTQFPSLFSDLLDSQPAGQRTSRGPERESPAAAHFLQAFLTASRPPEATPNSGDAPAAGDAPVAVSAGDFVAQHTFPPSPSGDGTSGPRPFGRDLLQGIRSAGFPTAQRAAELAGRGRVSQADPEPGDPNRELADFLGRLPNTEREPTAGGRVAHWPPGSPQLRGRIGTTWEPENQGVGDTNGLEWPALGLGTPLSPLSSAAHGPSTAWDLVGAEVPLEGAVSRASGANDLPPGQTPRVAGHLPPWRTSGSLAPAVGLAGNPGASADQSVVHFAFDSTNPVTTTAAGPLVAGQPSGGLAPPTLGPPIATGVAGEGLPGQVGTTASDPRFAGSAGEFRSAGAATSPADPGPGAANLGGPAPGALGLTNGKMVSPRRAANDQAPSSQARRELRGRTGGEPADPGPQAAVRFGNASPATGRPGVGSPLAGTEPMADLPIGSSGAGAANEAWPSAQTLGTLELDLQVGGRGDSFAGLFGDAVASHDLPGTWTAAEGQRATSSTSAFSEPGGAQAAGRPTADKVLHQVSQTLRQLPTGDSTLRLQLNPLELGQLEIEISFRNGVMMGKLRAEQGQTWKLLQDGIDGLRTRLQEQGIVVQSLEVELGRPSDFSQHHQRSPQQSFDWDQQRQSGGYFADQDPAEKRPRRIREQPEAGVEPAKTRNGGWAVNVVI